MSRQPDWDRLVNEVVSKIDIIRAGWEHTQQHQPELHEALVQGVYIPALSKLAEFCICVTEHGDPEMN